MITPPHPFAIILYKRAVSLYTLLSIISMMNDVLRFCDFDVNNDLYTIGQYFLHPEAMAEVLLYLGSPNLEKKLNELDEVQKESRKARDLTFTI